ncbi:hypothetical protein LINPERPRIM_LOCUS36329 [Linum perenne]
MIMRRWARGIKPVEVSDGNSPEWITFQKVSPAVITIEGINWLSSLIGKPMRNFVREGLDIKVCIIRDKAVPCPKSISVFDEEEEHVIPMIQAKARDYRKEGRKQIWVRTEPVKANVGDNVTAPKVDEMVMVLEGKVEDANVHTPVGNEMHQHSSSESKKRKAKKKK